MIKRKRIMYASVFFVAVLFVMQSKGMLEQLRQWWYQGIGSGEFLEERESPSELPHEDWEILKETPPALYEAQKYAKEVTQTIYMTWAVLLKRFVRVA